MDTPDNAASNPAGDRSQNDESYQSPALSRLHRSRRSEGPIRRIVGLQPGGLPPPDDGLEAVRARLEQLEQQQRELVANLFAAHAAFRRLAERVARLEQPADDRTEQSARPA